MISLCVRSDGRVHFNSYNLVVSVGSVIWNRYTTSSGMICVDLDCGRIGGQLRESGRWMDSLGVRNEEIWALRLKRRRRAEHYAVVCCGPFSWI